MFLLQSAQAGGDPRPILSGLEQTAARGRFLVHFTDTGADAVDADVPGRVLDALEASEAFYLADGWRPVVSDGEDAEIDLYLRDVEINGYAHPVDVGEEHANACWMEVDAGLGDVGGLVLESVAAHEFHHCVEYAYTPHADGWFYEATATYAQYVVVTDELLDLAVGVLWSQRLAEPERRIDDRGNRFEYAAFAWVKFWTELDGGDPFRAPELWEALVADDADWETAHEHEAQRVFGRSLDEVFLEHGTWNAFACGDDDGAHYDPSSHPCRLDAGVPIEPVVDDQFVAEHIDDPYTTRYFEIAAAGDARPVQVDCGDPGEDARAGVMLVARDAVRIGGPQASAWGSQGESLSVRLDDALDPNGSVLVVHASTGRDPAVQTCDVSRVEPIVPEDKGCATSPAAPILGMLIALFAVRRRAA